MADDKRSMLVDKSGKPLDEDDQDGPVVSAKAAPDERLRDKDGKLLSEGDQTGPVVAAKAAGSKKKMMNKLYDNPRSKSDD